jgi:hypothetical protein
MPLTYAFRLTPGPQALDQAILAEKLSYERVWSPEIPAFGHDIWVHLARLIEHTPHRYWSGGANHGLPPSGGPNHPRSPRSSTSRAFVHRSDRDGAEATVVGSFGRRLEIIRIADRLQPGGGLTHLARL